MNTISDLFIKQKIKFKFVLFSSSQSLCTYLHAYVLTLFSILISIYYHLKTLVNRGKSKIGATSIQVKYMCAYSAEIIQRRKLIKGGNY